MILRTKNPDDARRDYVWRRDEELARHDAAPVMTMSFESFSAAYRDEYSGADRADIWAPHRRRFRLAIDTLEGQHIGNVTLYDIDHDRHQAELGIMIGDKRYWGHSYGTDSVISLLLEVFRRTDLQRVYLHTLDWNVRAQQSFAKAGFREIGMTYEGQYRFVEMEVLRKDFLERFASYRSIPEPLDGNPQTA